MKRYFLLMLTAVFALQLSAQTNNFKKNNIGLFVDWSMYAGNSKGEGADVQLGLTYNLTYGVKYLRNFHSVFGAGAGIHYQYQAFRLKQNDDKKVPNAITHDKEVLKFNNLGSEVFMRFNIIKKLSKTLLYAETGGYFNWVFGANDYTFDKVDNGLPSSTSSKQTVILSDLNYIKKINYGVSLKVGYKMFALIAQYRLSDYFTDDFKRDIADVTFPRFSIGIQFNPIN